MLFPLRYSAARKFGATCLFVLAGFTQLAVCGAKEIYWSGTTMKNPGFDGYTAIEFDKGDVLYLDATPIDPLQFPDFKPISVGSVLQRDTTYFVKIGPYKEFQDGDPIYYAEYKPFELLYSLGLDKYFPDIKTRSYPVVMSSKLTQAKVDDTGEGYSIWPYYIRSSDMLTKEGILRQDTQNVAWVALQMADKVNTPLMEYQAEIIKPRESTIYLEHVIFMNGFSTNNGGAISLPEPRTEYVDPDNRNGDTPRVKTNIAGDVAFFNNTAQDAGGALYTTYPLRFMGNVYFVGNKSLYGMVASDGIWAFNAAGDGGNDVGTRLKGGGAVCLFNSTQYITNSMEFDQSAYFVGNMTSDKGGGLFVGKGINVDFRGKAVFIGNSAGLYQNIASNKQSTPYVLGSGGGINMNEDGSVTFASESIFIGNIASGYGGGIAGSKRSPKFVFRGDALFTDNRAGYEQRTITVAAPNIHAGTQLTLFGKPADGGGIYAGGAATFDAGASATFLRNWAVGSGGGIGTTTLDAGNHASSVSGAGAITNLAVRFTGNTTFINNVAGVQGGAISAGNFGMGSATSTWASRAGVYFNGEQHGRLLMQGNIAYSPTLVLSATGLASGWDSIYRTGTITSGPDKNNDSHILPVIGGGAILAASGLTIHQIFEFSNNQTGGAGGAILVGTNANRFTPTRNGATLTNKATIEINPLDWEAPGAYDKTGEYATFRDNLALQNGGAIAAKAETGVYIGSGVKFIDNAAAGEGGAIVMGDTIMTSSGDLYSGSLGLGALTLAARVADIVFSGNRAGVTVDTSTFDRDSILDPSGTKAGGFLTPDMTTGRPNDIYFSVASSSTVAVKASTLTMNAYEGMKIFLDGGIGTSSSMNVLTININSTGDSATHTSVPDTILGNTSPVGKIIFDNANVDAKASTTVQNGTLRIQGTGTGLFWGNELARMTAGTKFELRGAATLEANATIRAINFIIGDGATLSVLGDANTGLGGTLTLSSGTGITYQGKVNLAGNGRINLGIASGTNFASIAVGEAGRASGQTLTIAKDSATGVQMTLRNTRLIMGLFGGNDSDRVVGSSTITVSGSNMISLSSLASGTYTLLTSNAVIAASPQYTIDYKGAVLTNNARLSVSATTLSNGIQLTYTTTNAVLNWNTGTMGAGLWNQTGTIWTDGGSISSFVMGDVVNFRSSPLANGTGTATVSQNLVASGVVVDGDYIFQGNGAITVDSKSWGGSARPAAANGRLIKTGADTTLTFANARQGEGNNFVGGLEIVGGIVDVSTLAQLGITLDRLIFSATSISDNATLRVSAPITLDASVSVGSQRLNIDAGRVGTITTGTNSSLSIMNNLAASGVKGGAIYVGNSGTLTLAAAGGDISIKNNKADHGGAIYLDENATLDFAVASGRRITVGIGRIDTLNTLANTSLIDSIGGSASSMIYKTGAGVLSLNADSSGFAGTTIIKEGSLLIGAGGKLGGDIYVSGSGSAFGGEARILGDVYMGKETVLPVGSDDSKVSGTLVFDRGLYLQDTTIKYHGYVSVDNVYNTDTIIAGKATFSGTTVVDFNKINSGSSVLISTGTDIAWSPLDYYISVNGKKINPYRVDAGIDYDQFETITGTSFVSGTATLITGTIFDKSKLVLTTIVNNDKATWTGSSTQMVTVSGTAYAGWNTAHESWVLSSTLMAGENTFFDGDSIVFDGKTDAGREDMRNIYVDSKGVGVADMTVTGTATYNISGGSIKSVVGGNNYGYWTQDPSSPEKQMFVDLSTGQLLLDENFTGLLVLKNEKTYFTGKVTSEGTSPGIFIRSGTLETIAKVIEGNTVLNNGYLVFDEGSNGAFKGEINGDGTFVKKGVGTMTVNGLGIMRGRNYDILEGTLNVGEEAGLSLTGTLIIHPVGALSIAGERMSVPLIVNKGLLQHQAYVEDMKAITLADNGVYIAGNYIGEGGYINIAGFQKMIYNDYFVFSGNSKGTGTVRIHLYSFTEEQMGSATPAPKRDSLIFVTQGPSREVKLTMDWTESDFGAMDTADNYQFLQGKDGNWYLRNLTVAPGSSQMPYVAAAPAVADLLAKAQIRALFQRTSARHDDMKEGGTFWSSYAHNEDRIRSDYYNGTMLKADIFQMGADYTFIPAGKGIFQLSGGAVCSFTSAKATRLDMSTMSVDTQTFNLYGSARMGRIYLDAVGTFSPDTTYEAITNYGLDANGEVDGSYMGLSTELGVIINPIGGGQLEPYLQLVGLKHSFGTISTPKSRNEFDSPTATNRRDYYFKDPTTLRGTVGLRWGSHLNVTEKLSVRPWGGLAWGRNLSNDYVIVVGDHHMRNDMRGHFYTFSGGASVQWKSNLQGYVTLEWTGGQMNANYSLYSGINYRW